MEIKEVKDALGNYYIEIETELSTLVFERLSQDTQFKSKLEELVSDFMLKHEQEAENDILDNLREIEENEDCEIKVSVDDVSCLVKVDYHGKSALNNIDYSIAVDTENKKVTNCCGSKEVEEMILKTLKGE